MTFKTFLTFITSEKIRLSHKYGIKFDEASVYPQTIKLMEELGELCNEVLGRFGLQRQEKLKGNNQAALEKELADVIISVLILADILEVDIEKMLEKRIKQIEDRHIN